MSGLYSNQKPKAALFNIGIAIGVCTFFYFPSLAFAALIIFGLAITRPFKLAEWLIALLGIITPYYFLLAIVFLTDKWKGYNFPGFAITTPVFQSVAMGICSHCAGISSCNGRHMLCTAKFQASVDTGTKKLEPYFFVPDGSHFCALCKCHPYFRILDPVRCTIVGFCCGSIFIPGKKMVSHRFTLAHGRFCNRNQLLGLKIEFLIVPLRPEY